MPTPSQLGIIAVLVVRFHATHGQDIVAAYPEDHVLSEEQLIDAKMLSMQERIEGSPNQMGRHVFKLREKKACAECDKTKDLFAYSVFLRCKDSVMSTRGYFHQSVVIVTNLHRHVGLCSPTGAAYRTLFYNIASTLSHILADFPSSEHSNASLCHKVEDDRKGSKASSSVDSSLHRTLEVAFSHFRQWDRLFCDGGQELVQLPFFGDMLDFYIPGSNTHDDATSLVNATAVLARLGLIPHIWTLWELLHRGKDIVFFSPSASVTSAAILSVLSLLSTGADLEDGYDVRPYIASYDNDLRTILTRTRESSRATFETQKSHIQSRIGFIGGASLPYHARLVGITNPHLLRSLEQYHCCLMLPNPDIGHDCSTLFMGRLMRRTSSVEEASVKKSEATAIKGNKSGAWSGGLSGWFSLGSKGEELATHEPSQDDPEACVAFTPLGVGYISSQVARNFYEQNADHCYDIDDHGQRTYRPVLKPAEPNGIPYVTPGACPVVFRCLEDQINSTAEYNGSFEKIHDMWIERLWSRMSICTASEVLGPTKSTSGSRNSNNSRYSFEETKSNLSKSVHGKCFGLLLARSTSGPGSPFSLTIKPEKNTQEKLDSVLCSADSNVASAIAIANVLLKEHIYHLNTALMGPFRLLANITDPVDADRQVHDMEALHAFYAGSPGDGERLSNVAAEENAAAEEEMELLIGAIAAFQRQSIPSAEESRAGSDSLHVPVCIRKLFFDHSQSASSSSSGGVCSPFLLDVARARFIQEWMRNQRKSKY